MVRLACPIMLMSVTTSHPFRETSLKSKSGYHGKTCNGELKQLIYNIFLHRKNKRNARLRRRNRSVETDAGAAKELEFSEFEFSEFELSEFKNYRFNSFDANQRILVANSNCQKIGAEQTNECKAVMDFVAKNGNFLRKDSEPEESTSRSTRNTRKYIQVMQRLNKICCEDRGFRLSCGKADKEEIQRHMNDRKFRNNFVVRYRKG